MLTDDDYSNLIKYIGLFINQLGDSINQNYNNESRYDKLCKIRNSAENLKLKLCTEWRLILSGRQ